MTAMPSVANFSESRILHPTIICFCHLRWNSVFQRPQHIMTRLAETHRVLFIEEPIYDAENPKLQFQKASRVEIVTPHLSKGLSRDEENAILRGLVSELLEEQNIEQPVLWYYTPMMLAFSAGINAKSVVYDCMDELSGFKFASADLSNRERALIQRADTMFTGGQSLYAAKKHLHHNIHAFPSSVDRAHFGRARSADCVEAADQQLLSGPKLGFFGVIDERMDLALLAHLADARPHWNIVLVGPVVKINPDDLPRRSNIHYLGAKTYEELPSYLKGWDVALMPFALNEATRFISPTKTPEYLAGGCPVVSTPITDVVQTYGGLRGVGIASTPDAFVAACEDALSLKAGSGAWLDEADRLLADMSWSGTVAQMRALVPGLVVQSAAVRPIRPAAQRARVDYMIVGAGFSGAVLAERLASEADCKVMVVDRRPHIGGNAYDHLNDAGILIHKYGPHIFHTNSEEIFRYLSRFTAWRPYEHKVLSNVGDLLLPVPINRTTLNSLYGLNLQNDKDAADFLAARAEPLSEIRTSEDVVISTVGRDLYEKFFRGYTRKQWGMDPSQLDKSVTARIPVRTNTDDRYFTDRFQFMPKAGYTRLFENMLDHPNIALTLDCDFKDIDIEYDRLIYCGPIDEYFGYRLGKLPYRSLRFQHETVACKHFQPAAVVNYPSENVPYTRITEYKWLTGQTHKETSISYEFPSDEGDPYYPIPNEENFDLLRRYEALARSEADVTFAGRLGTYRYYNMDQVVGQALAIYRRLRLATGTQEAASIAAA